jgi:hypothetical protein
LSYQIKPEAHGTGKITMFTEPVLLVSDAHGVFMMQLLIDENKKSNSLFFRQLSEKLSSEDLAILLEGPDHEFHFEVCDDVCNLTFTEEDGQEYFLSYEEGGIFAIPSGYEFENN